LESKSAALVAAVFVDFPKNKCNFLHKNKLDIVRRVQLLTGRRLMRSFSIGAVPTAAPRSRRLWPAPTQPASVMNCLSVISFLHSLSLSFLPARLYASAGTSYSSCLSHKSAPLKLRPLGATQTWEMKKNYAMQYKKYKNQAAMNLTPPPSQNSHAIRWHCSCTAESLLLLLLFWQNGRTN